MPLRNNHPLTAFFYCEKPRFATFFCFISLEKDFFRVYNCKE